MTLIDTLFRRSWTAAQWCDLARRTHADTSRAMMQRRIGAFQASVEAVRQGQSSAAAAASVDRIDMQNEMSRKRLWERLREINERALELDPKNGDAWYQRAYILLNGRADSKDLRAALDCLQRAAEFAAPRRAETFYYTGQVLLDLDRAEEAVLAFDAAIAASPGDDELWYSRAQALSRLGKTSESEQSLERARALQKERTGEEPGALRVVTARKF